MKCIYCNAEPEIISVAKLSDEINQYGHREIIYEAETFDPIEYKNKLYHCKKCGKTFTFQESIKEKPKEQTLLEKMFNVTN